MRWEIDGWLGGLLLLLWPPIAATLLRFLVQRLHKSTPTTARLFFWFWLWVFGSCSVMALVGLHAAPAIAFDVGWSSLGRGQAQMLGMLAGVFFSLPVAYAFPQFRRLAKQHDLAMREMKGVPLVSEIPNHRPSAISIAITLGTLALGFAAIWLVFPLGMIVLSPVLLGIGMALLVFTLMPNAGAAMPGGRGRFLLGLILMHGVPFAAVFAAQAIWPDNGRLEGLVITLCGVILGVVIYLWALRRISFTRALLNDLDTAQKKTG